MIKVFDRHRVKFGEQHEYINDAIVVTIVSLELVVAIIDDDHGGIWHV